MYQIYLVIPGRCFFVLSLQAGPSDDLVHPWIELKLDHNNTILFLNYDWALVPNHVLSLDATQKAQISVEMSNGNPVDKPTLFVWIKSLDSCK